MPVVWCNSTSFDGIIPVNNISPTDDVIPISTLAASSSFPANSFSGFTTGTTETNTSGGGYNLFYPTPHDNSTIICQSNRMWRDVEVSACCSDHFLLLIRATPPLSFFASRSALYFDFNVSSFPPGGDIRMGMIQNGVAYPYYVNTNVAASPEGIAVGFTGSVTGTDLFTFGASGFNIYLKWNGKTLFSYTDWRVMGAGVTCASGNGLSNVYRVHYLQNQVLYSNYAAGVFDPRDFGMRNVPVNTGSMSASGTSLTLNRQNQFQVGDSVIVEIGGESGAGARGTIGVGGNFPSLSYANAAAMNADTGQPDGTWAYLLDTKLAYSSIAGVWTNGDGITTTGHYNQTYYQQYVQPLALAATVTAISGQVLTLSTAATVATTNANVYLDCKNSFLPINQTVRSETNFPPTPINMSISIPAGTYAVSNVVTNTGADWIGNGYSVYGAGRTQTTIFTPLGLIPKFLNLSAATNNPSNVTISDFKYIGNFNNNGGCTFGIGLATAVTGEPRAVEIFSAGNSNTIARVDALNTVCAIGIDNSHLALIDNCTVEITSGQYNYLQWQIACDNCSDAIIQNCTGTAPFGMKCFEFFVCYPGTGAYGGKFLNCGGQNVRFSNNSSHLIIFDMTQNVTATTGSWFSPGATPIDEAIFNINSNAFHSGGDGQFICRAGFQCIQQGYVKGGNDSFKFIQVSSEQGTWSFTGGFPGGGCSTALGGYFEAPDYNAGGAEFGSMLLMSDANNTTITGMRVKGSAIPSPGSSGHWSNISLLGTGSSVTNCVADVIQPGPTTSGNQTNIVYCP